MNGNFKDDDGMYRPQIMALGQRFEETYREEFYAYVNNQRASLHYTKRMAEESRKVAERAKKRIKTAGDFDDAKEWAQNELNTRKTVVQAETSAIRNAPIP